MKYKKFGILLALPAILGMIATYFRILVLIPIIIVLMFVLVAVVPFTRKHESLWLFLICAVSSIPLNLFFLREYTGWKYFLCVNPNVKLFSVLATIEAMLILTSVEEVIVGFIGRLIWRRQYKLSISEISEE